MVEKLSRRDALKLLGAIGGGVIACSGGSIGLMVAYRAIRDNQPTILIVDDDPTPSVMQLPIVPREQWGALPPNNNAENENGFYDPDTNSVGWRVYEGNLADNYQTLVLHHSVIYTNNDEQTLLDVQTLHHNRGWADVGYHFLVGQNGTIYEGRDWSVRGTHVGGFNTGSIGVCLLGNFQENAPTPAQITNTRELIIYLAAVLQLTHIAGHRNFNDGTQCPGNNVVTYMDDFAQAANLSVGTEGYIPPTEQQANGCSCCGCNQVV